MEGVRAAMTTRRLEADQWLNRKEWRLGSGRRRRLSQDRNNIYIYIYIYIYIVIYNLKFHTVIMIVTTNHDTEYVIVQLG